MIPYLDALNGFLTLFSLMPLPFRAFIVTNLAVLLGLAIIRILTTRT